MLHTALFLLFSLLACPFLEWRMTLALSVRGFFGVDVPSLISMSSGWPPAYLAVSTFSIFPHCKNCWSWFEIIIEVIKMILNLTMCFSSLTAFFFCCRIILLKADDPTPKGCAVALVGDKCEVHLHIKVSKAFLYYQAANFYSFLILRIQPVFSTFMQLLSQ